jgi:hypothetical protein
MTKQVILGVKRSVFFFYCRYSPLGARSTALWSVEIWSRVSEFDGDHILSDINLSKYLYTEILNRHQMLNLFTGVTKCVLSLPPFLWLVLFLRADTSIGSYILNR